MKKKILESYVLIYLMTSFFVYLLVEEVSKVRSWASRSLLSERKAPKGAIPEVT